MTTSAEAAPRRRSRRGQGDQLRGEILAAAERLLAERGSEEAVSIRAIADVIGVTPPSIYLHFADKEELFVAVCGERFGELDRISEAAARDAVDALDEVRRRGEAYVRFGVENPAQYRVLFMVRLSYISVDHLKKWACLQHMVEAVERAMAAGQLAAGDPFTVTLQLWAAVHGLTSLMITKPEIPWPPVADIVDGVLDMCAFGLTVRPDSKRPARRRR